MSLTSGADPATRDNATKAEIREVLARLAGRTADAGTFAGLRTDRLAKATPDDLGDHVTFFRPRLHTGERVSSYLLGSDRGRRTSRCRRRWPNSFPAKSSASGSGRLMRGRWR